MRYMLDANAGILLLMGHPGVVARASQCFEGDLAISAIAFAEIALGTARGKPPEAAGLDRLLTRVHLLPFNEAAANMYARLPFRRASYDRLIAAHALAADLVLVTANRRDFADVPDLRVEDWTA